MVYVAEDSLAQTLDNLEEAFFTGQELSVAERLAAAQWLARRVGQRHSYRGLIAPTDKDVSQGFRLFTGEPVSSGARIRNILGESASWALARLNASDSTAQAALSQARAAIAEWGIQPDGQGRFCCGMCTAAMMRFLNVSGLPDAQERIASGLRGMRDLRTGHGAWRTFPHFYTVLMLTELDPDLAAEELAYVGPKCARQFGKQRGDYAPRRETILERIVASF